MIVAWSVPTVAGVYTTTITGQINTAGPTNAATAKFVLSVRSCKTSSDQIIITPPAATTRTIALSEATGGQQTVDQFGL